MKKVPVVAVADYAEEARLASPRRARPRGDRGARRGRSGGEGRAARVRVRYRPCRDGPDDGGRAHRAHRPQAREDPRPQRQLARLDARLGRRRRPQGPHVPPAWPHERGRGGRARHPGGVLARGPPSTPRRRAHACQRGDASPRDRGRARRHRARQDREGDEQVRYLPAGSEGDRASALGAERLGPVEPQGGRRHGRRDRARRPVLRRLPRDHRGWHEGVRRAVARLHPNGTVVTSLLADLQARGLSTTTGLLVVIDGSRALAAGVRRVFGEDAEVQMHPHKRRNVSDHLPKDLQNTIDRRLAAAFGHTEWTTGIDRAKAIAREPKAERSFRRVKGHPRTLESPRRRPGIVRVD